MESLGTRREFSCQKWEGKRKKKHHLIHGGRSTYYQKNRYFQNFKKDLAVSGGGGKTANFQ